MTFTAKQLRERVRNMTMDSDGRERTSRDMLNDFLRDAITEIVEQADWPPMQARYELAVTAGTAEYDVPAAKIDAVYTETGERVPYVSDFALSEITPDGLCYLTKQYPLRIQLAPVPATDFFLFLEVYRPVTLPDPDDAAVPLPNDLCVAVAYLAAAKIAERDGVPDQANYFRQVSASQVRKARRHKGPRTNELMRMAFEMPVWN